MRLNAGTSLIGMLALTLAGCSYLPESGPSRFAIDRGATASVEIERRAVVMDYVMLDLSQQVLANLSGVGPESLFRSFGTGKGGIPDIRIGIGDAVQITIYEAASGGLFSSAGDISMRPGNFVTLPLQNVDRAGNVSVPYVGRIHVSGRTVEQVQRQIESRLSQRAIEPQVVISLPEQTSADVSVFGDATGSFRARVRSGGERVLDMIARAGVRYPGHEVFVTLQRGHRRATVHFPVLLEHPDENIYVQPGDVIYVNRSQQRFSVFGATGGTTQTSGLSGQFPFETPDLYLTEAVARAGGLLDSRANARQVFLYRLEHRAALEKMGVSLEAFPPDMKMIPTIYRANFRDPSIFFTAGQFQMRHRDIIYVANADAIELEKFLSHIRFVTSSVAGVSSDALATRDAVRALGR